jgi:glyoxylate carboligase
VFQTKPLRQWRAASRFWQVTHATARHVIAKVLCAVGRNRIEEEIMGIIMINCPATGHGVSTGIEVCATDQLPIVIATTICPDCGRVHTWTKNEAWLVNGGDEYRGAQSRKRASG